MLQYTSPNCRNKSDIILYFVRDHKHHFGHQITYPLEQGTCTVYCAFVLFNFVNTWMALQVLNHQGVKNQVYRSSPINPYHEF